MNIEKLVDNARAEICRKLKCDIQLADTERIKSADPTLLNPNINLVQMIDHTLLKPDATEEQIKKLCWEAVDYCFASVCVNSHYIPHAVYALMESSVKVCSVVGFPLGASSTSVKVKETEVAVKTGAQEIDTVINIGALKSGRIDFVKNDIQEVKAAAGEKALVKVIIETCLLTDEEKVIACLLSKMAGADFVKTSTGFSTDGARIEDVRLMRMVVGSSMGVKASGGIKSYETAVEMIEAGANRIGTSSGVAIVLKQRSIIG
jgi:deoxyribose-phosphate aldolase